MFAFGKLLIFVTPAIGSIELWLGSAYMTYLIMNLKSKESKARTNLFTVMLRSDVFWISPVILFRPSCPLSSFFFGKTQGKPWWRTL
jgi:hypothetical protein